MKEANTESRMLTDQTEAAGELPGQPTAKFANLLGDVFTTTPTRPAAGAQATKREFTLGNYINTGSTGKTFDSPASQQPMSGRSPFTPPQIQVLAPPTEDDGDLCMRPRQQAKPMLTPQAAQQQQYFYSQASPQPAPVVQHMPVTSPFTFETKAKPQQKAPAQVPAANTLLVNDSPPDFRLIPT